MIRIKATKLRLWLLGAEENEEEKAQSITIIHV